MTMPEDSGYILSEDPIYEDGQIRRHATDDSEIFVEFFSFLPAISGSLPLGLQEYLESYGELRGILLDRGLSSYIPEVVDYDLDDSWIAFGIPEGLYSLPEVAKSFPDGLDGRDWAWMFRRALMVLDAGTRRPRISEQNFLVHPEGHGIVLLGWQPVEDPDSYPLDELHRLMESYLADTVDAAQQIDLVSKMEIAYRKNRDGHKDARIDPEGMLFGYETALNEYEMKLRTLYGPPKFRALTVGPSSEPFLQQESKNVAASLGQ